ncbi:MAG: PEP-CTERM sorting domain-containing protein [Akkermansiaceae bacterium]|nr:PEP-CTERM sorting domain-containing protein [Akkermansiaceae bacterium]
MAVASLIGPGQAATITWGSASGITSSTSVLNNGSAVSAINYAGTAQTVNGVSFASGGGETSTWWTGYGGNSTGDAGLDNILNNHQTSYGSPTHPTEFEMSLTGLSIGQQYQIQLIGIHDLRSATSTRTYTLPDQTGVTPAYTGPQLARGAGGNDGGGSGSAAGTVVGTFTAGAVTEVIWITNTVAPGGNDPGLSGYALRAIPEPSSAALLGLGGLALILRRRK